MKNAGEGGDRSVSGLNIKIPHSRLAFAVLNQEAGEESTSIPETFEIRIRRNSGHVDA